MSLQLNLTRYPEGCNEKVYVKYVRIHNISHLDTYGPWLGCVAEVSVLYGLLPTQNEKK